jgi:hypothetical protein
VSLLLPAPDPAAWLAMHLDTHFDERGGAIDPNDDSSATRWIGVPELLAEDGAIVRRLHTSLVAQGLPARAAATYVAGWIAGALADATGFALAMSGAGYQATAGSVRWHQHRGGWVDRVDLRCCRVVVPVGHPWSGQPGVDTVCDRQIVRELAVLALVAVAMPIIDVCHSLTRVGRGGLWNEVGDALGTAVAFQPSLPVMPDVVDTLAAAVGTRGVPWKSRPTLRIADSARGPVYVAQKGGCCLAYTRPTQPALNPDELDPQYRAFLERFPESQACQRYCSTCSLRDFGDCEARQLFWLKLESDHR